MERDSINEQWIHIISWAVSAAARLTPDYTNCVWCSACKSILPNYYKHFPPVLMTGGGKKERHFLLLTHSKAPPLRISFVPKMSISKGIQVWLQITSFKSVLHVWSYVIAGGQMCAVLTAHVCHVPLFQLTTYHFRYAWVQPELIQNSSSSVLFTLWRKKIQQ